MRSKQNLLIFLMFLSGCSGIQIRNQDSALQQFAPNILIVSEPVGKGYFALLENSSGQWKVIGDLSTQPLSRFSEYQEVLFINDSLRSIAPAFDKPLNTDGAHCTPYLDKNSWYWLCTSHFSSISYANTIGRNLVSCLFTLCLAAGSRVELDHEKIIEAVIQSKLIDLAKDRILVDNRKKYLLEYSKSMKSEDIVQLQYFVSKYREHDSDNLVPEALLKINAILDSKKNYSKLNDILDHVADQRSSDYD